MDAPNVASIRVATRLGMSRRTPPVAGAEDTVFYGIGRGEWRSRR